MDRLLQKYNLHRIVVDSGYESEENYKYYNNEMIDYDIVTNKINKFREFSRQWLLGKLDYENNKK